MQKNTLEYFSFNALFFTADISVLNVWIMTEDSYISVAISFSTVFSQQFLNLPFQPLLPPLLPPQNRNTLKYI